MEEIMIRKGFKEKKIVMLLTIQVLFSIFILQGMCQEGTGTVSGRVVDTEGNHIPALPVFIAPLEIHDGLTFPLYHPPYGYFDMKRTQTKTDGSFTITGIPPGPHYFGILSKDIDQRLPDNYDEILRDFLTWNDKGINSGYINSFTQTNFGFQEHDFEPDVKVVSLRINGIDFYPRNDFVEIGFGIDSDIHIKNVEVIVRPRMRIQGGVIFKDGTPLSNARIRISLNFRYEDDSGRGIRGGGTGVWIDDKGNFVQYLSDRDKTVIYTLSLEYQGLVTPSEEVRLEPGQRIDGLTFTFDSEPIPPKPLPPKMRTEKGKVQPSSTPEQPPLPLSNEVWIVNPANGHAYKRVYCRARDEAIAQAKNENAYLVTINDSKEQEWLGAVFGHSLYWIGLSADRKDGKWKWDNGEPITYENWLPHDYFSEVLDKNEREYAITTFADGKWYAVHPKSVMVKMTEMAIIEKDGILSDIKLKSVGKDR